MDSVDEDAAYNKKANAGKGGADGEKKPWKPKTDGAAAAATGGGGGGGAAGEKKTWKPRTPKEHAQRPKDHNGQQIATNQCQ